MESVEYRIDDSFFPSFASVTIALPSASSLAWVITFTKYSFTCIAAIALAVGVKLNICLDEL